MTQLRPLEEGFEKEYATAVIGVDTLWGGDVGSPSGRKHIIADSFPRDEVELPPVYHDERAAMLRERGGCAGIKGDQDALKTLEGFLKDHGLEDFRSRVWGAVFRDPKPAEAHEKSARSNLIGHMLEALTVIKNTALALGRGEPLPSFETRYRAAVLKDPHLVNTERLRENLRVALADVGFEVTNSRNLRETMLAWEKQRGYVPVEQFKQKMNETREKLMALLRRNMFAEMDFELPGHDKHLEDVAFDGMRLETLSDARFTASSAYQGGLNQDGSPALQGLIEYNTDHKVSTDGIWGLTAHEIIAHYVDGAMADLRWRAGQIGLEGMMTTMCTPAVALNEGLAQHMLKLACGGTEDDVVHEFGENQRVQFALERLQDAAKNNAPTLFQLHGMTLETIQRYLEVDCVLSDHLVKKISSAWTQHPVYGVMYGPAYFEGHRVVGELMQHHGPHPVLQAALHRWGYADIKTIRQVLSQRKT